ncbi:MAG: anaerobic ribonucleoside-triphosphate reductase activating protein [Ruminococcaceae bacterium]|nr:anaerobic ribonucleoside-triphosphate reductase activating protein [Oscillospiraceae bacterium]
MIIQGLQKLTLLDFPGHTACTVFTPGCNFRCPFCHNASLVTHIDADPVCTEEEFFSFLKKRQGLLDGVAVTGGEPLLQKDIVPFLEKVRALGFAVKLDTNGSRPDVLKAIVRAGLVDYVAMDVKNTKEKYPLTAGIDGTLLDAVEESIDFLLTNAVDYEFRTTLVKNFHTKEDIVSMSHRLQGAKRWFLQFFKDSGDLIDGSCIGFTPAEMREMLDSARFAAPFAEIRGVE